jgi:hypothetical protein
MKGEIDELVSRARKYYERLGFTVEKVNSRSGTVTVECSGPEKITFIYDENKL